VQAVRCPWLFAVILVAIAAPAFAQTPGGGTAPAARAYAGRLLTDVLREMQAAGLKIVFSSELVRPDIRVVAEPRARSPRPC
jgi:hypothetical protein